ncbi:hypothetical protein REPUB_Repub01dG0086300 [Reevesia pubescens]
MASISVHLSGSGHVEANASADGGSRSIRDKVTRFASFCYADDEGRLHGMIGEGYGVPYLSQNLLLLERAMEEEQGQWLGCQLLKIFQLVVRGARVMERLPQRWLELNRVNLTGLKEERENRRKFYDSV